MESSLHEWLFNSAEEFGEYNSDESRLVAVGTFLFQTQSEKSEEEETPMNYISLEEICSNLSNALGIVLSKAMSFEILTEALLIYAVSPQSPEKGLFVQIIMELSSDVQSHLMEAIKGNLQRHDLDEVVDNEDSEKPSDVTAPVEYAAAEDDSNALQTCTAVKMSCMECKSKETDLDRVSSELATALLNYTELETKLRAEVAQQGNKLVDTELIIIDREEQIAECKIIITELKKKVEFLEKEAKRSDIASEELQALRDEIDILKPKAERLESCQSQLEKLREKIDELKDVKQQLKKEQTGHSETFSRLLTAEHDLELLQKAKAQLDEYRVQYAEATIQIDELSLRLRQKDEHLKNLIEKNDDLSGSQKCQIIQSQSLAEELKATTDHLREMERVGGIGESMSELNPALMQELEKLRSENASLTERLDTSSLESLDRLEKQLGDQKAMTSSLQLKWVSTKDSLAAALATIASLTTVQAQLIESLGLAAADVEAMQSRNLSKETALAQIHRQEIAELTLRHGSLLDETNCRLTQTKTFLGEKTIELAEMTDENSSLLSNLTETQSKLNESENKRKRHEEETELEIVTLKKRHIDDITALKEAEEQRAAELASQHESSIEAEISRTRQAQADLEEERLKRRRVEREKKLHESEAHRYKSQLQTSGSSGGGDVESALKEIKSMEKQLDAANAELALYKSSSGGNCKESGSTLSRNSSAGPSSSGPLRIKPSEGNGTFYGGFIEQSDLSDKRVEQITREKRELLAKYLEESKEKGEVQQKLILSEKEIASLKSKMTKVILDKERLERKIALSKEKAIDKLNAENVANFSG